MPKSRIVVETTCVCGVLHQVRTLNPYRIIDPENLPAEVIEAAARAVEQYGVYDHSESVGKAALSAAFRTLGETQ